VRAFQVSQIPFNLGNLESALVDAIALIDNLAAKVDIEVSGLAYSSGQLAAILACSRSFIIKSLFVSAILPPLRAPGISFVLLPD
jgi:hypothetical protein